ncbi:MAG TPA: phenylalanine--tRNA ligase subunit beta, partial [Candidatus Avoscillospira stercoripullorum]|nr:phenylalanine--tRNA ligase subunit beta [Candidatus Avoscillospira stercoripullorum]
AILAQKAGILARGMGYSEILTYSFDSPKMFDAIRLPADSPLRSTVKILNPLGEDTSVMRTTALPAMLETLQRNVAFHNKAAKFYEVATIYLPKEGQTLPDEPKILSLGAYGAGVNFFTMKGELEAMLRCLGLQDPTYTAVTDDPSFHPGRCARVSAGGKDLGLFGQVHPLVAANYGMDVEVYAAQLSFSDFLSVRKAETVYCPLPKYPTVSRDLALVCDENKTVGCVEQCIAAAGGKLLKSVNLFDIYRGPGIPAGKKSLAFSLELRADDRTLTDEDTTAVVKKVLDKLEQELGVQLR